MDVTCPAHSNTRPDIKLFPYDSDHCSRNPVCVINRDMVKAELDTHPEDRNLEQTAYQNFLFLTHHSQELTKADKSKDYRLFHFCKRISCKLYAEGGFPICSETLSK